MHWNLLQVVATAALALTASANTVLPRQQKFVGYLITTFSDPVPKVQQYLSNGNNPFSWDKATRHGSRGLVIWQSKDLVN
ncbi:hypothetical protein FOBRF1_004409 [Fusarium oxysporum]